MFDGGSNLGKGIWRDVDGGGVDDCDGELDFEMLAGERHGELDVEEVADAEEAAWVNWILVSYELGSGERERVVMYLYRLRLNP